jgi:acetyl-CoA acetyltransferase family protein
MSRSRSHSRVLVASAVRTPIGRRGGALRSAHAPVLLGAVICEALDRAGVPADGVSQVLAGCVTQVGDQAYNVARIGWLTAGLPPSVPATTLDAQCGSSHQAVTLGSALIRAGASDIVVAAGVEVMSRHPLGSNVAAGPGEPMGARYREHFEITDQGEAAERIADRWDIDRAECDEIALRSQSLAAEAWRSGRFSAEVVPVDLPVADDADGGPNATLVRDEGPRASTMEDLAALAPVFRPDGRHTAGNSSQISDGAAAVVLVSEDAAAQYGISTLAEVTAFCAVGVDPAIKLTGPIPATWNVLAQAQLVPADIDLFEVNEAFASVIAAWRREIAVALEKVNVNGGAIALGHPVGASGARLCATAIHELRRRGDRRALVAMCCGGGLGTATIFEAAG